MSFKLIAVDSRCFYSFCPVDDRDVSRRFQFFELFGLRGRAKFIIWHGWWKGKFLQWNLLAPYEIVAKKTHCPVTLLIKIFLPRIHEQQMLHSTINEGVAKPVLSLLVFVDEKLNFQKIGDMTNELFLQTTDKKTYVTLCIILPSISALTWFAILTSKSTILYFKLHFVLIKC